MQNKDHKLIMSLLLVIVVLLVGGFVINVDVSAPSETRTIVDHSTQEYVSPTCIDDAEVTNYLQETTYSHALSLDYEAESTCSVEFFQESDVPLFMAMLQMIGVYDQKWSEEDLLNENMEG
ncbi:hypothetical protein [Natribacillus halophilus]|uniref:Uncharacterized protein n=1 Tax=Natribacillus halophilus TaxID=549003 RepID=A0A1G8MEY1_9BACI|nr:hypothetical protein [Natribacillus halophilus]SDI65900.1 hypothetical protein SAMN04488123_104103 [Natribacillus halophilus]